jgi:hypothetical protein
MSLEFGFMGKLLLEVREQRKHNNLKLQITLHVMEVTLCDHFLFLGDLSVPMASPEHSALKCFGYSIACYE